MSSNAIRSADKTMKHKPGDDFTNDVLDMKYIFIIDVAWLIIN